MKQTEEACGAESQATKRGPAEVSPLEGPPAATAPAWGTRWPRARGIPGHSTHEAYHPWSVILLAGLWLEMLGYNLTITIESMLLNCGVGENS